MGLAVVQGIVENYERAVLVEGEPEKGTMFTAYFPSVDKDTIPEVTF
jgi:sensor histidine kinase regulating citrate/malate metabolism